MVISPLGRPPSRPPGCGAQGLATLGSAAELGARPGHSWARQTPPPSEDPGQAFSEALSGS